MAEIHDQFDTILILDFGSQYSHLITRRCRELNVYAELMPCTSKLADLKFKPKGIILSGSPYSVYDDDAAHADPGIYTLGVPILGIRYGLQELCCNYKGQVQISRSSGSGNSVNALFEDSAIRCKCVWMSHGDQLSVMPPDFHFHPEVTHSPQGRQLIGRFVLNICQCRPNWTMEIVRIREICGPKGHVIGAVSGGVDSTVAAKLMHEAIGDRFHAIMVDNGVLRLNEAQQVNDMLNKDLGVNLTVVDASELFLSRLHGVEDPEQKRKIIGNTFINLLQGTLYPDVIESISFKGPSATIKTHHNVGKLLKDMKLKLIEPLRELFKDEVRALGRLLSIPAPLVQRHPFPGPGLAIRWVKILQQADHIYIKEIRKANFYNQISQAMTILLPVKAVGVMGDKRTYEQVIALRAVTSEDFMTADWYVLSYFLVLLRRISSNEVSGINRVTYDISSKPPATVEWL
ncbi:GMP synthase [Suillus spraguei]|nr:GMP synthase [Suillus spraguei]